MAKLFQEFGTYESSIEYIEQCSKYGAWQGHTKDFLTYEPFSGILVYSISQITGLSVISAAYLPIPYIIYCILLYGIFKIIYENIDENLPKNKFWKITSLFAVFVGIYSFICKFVIGKFYVLEYHGIYWVYILATYFLIIKAGTSLKKDSSTILLLTLIFIVNIYTHYQFPMTFLGGIFIYYVIYEACVKIGVSESHNIQSILKKLILLFATLLTLQNFYYVSLESNYGFLSIFTNLVDSLMAKIFSEQSSGILMSKSAYYYAQKLSFFNKLWHILFAILLCIVFLTIPIYSLKNLKKLKPLDYFYMAILGNDMTWIYTYYSKFVNHFSFYLLNSWILNVLILIPISEFFSIKHPFWNAIGRICWILLLFSSSLLLLTSTLEFDSIVKGYSAFDHIAVEYGNFAGKFIISNSFGGHDELILASIGVSSKLYENINYYDVQKLKTIFPKNAVTYIQSPTGKVNNNISDIYFLIKEDDVSKVILTEKELKDGFYGSLTTTPLDHTEMSIFKGFLDSKDNIIYNSQRSIVYDLN
jgi:hypothetical protein